MRKASLFSGIGGIDLAAHWAALQTVVFCEREPFPQRVLRKHWPDVPIIDDVHDFTREELERRGIIGPDRTIDLISAGYPCQPFSHAGKREGSEDDRHLWPEVKRILSEIRSRWFVGENVAGHVTLGLDDVLADLESLKYTAQAFVIPACAVYASHRRDRVFIVGYTEHDGLYGAKVRRSIDSAGNNIEEGTEETSESEGASGRANNAIVAYASRELSYGSRGERRGRHEHSNCCEDVAHSCGAGREECNASAVSIGPGHSPRGGDSFGGNRPTQPGMGGSAHELSNWLDGGINPLDALAEFIAQYPQPALMGQEQYDWEPPRVATGVKNRVARLKALGNAVDPLQIYPIMYAIKVIDDWLTGRSPKAK